MSNHCTVFSQPISLLRPPPPMRPDSVPDLGAIQIIYLLTYLLTMLTLCQLQNIFALYFTLYTSLSLHFRSFAFHILYDTCKVSCIGREYFLLSITVTFVVADGPLTSIKHVASISAVVCVLLGSAVTKKVRWSP